LICTGCGEIMDWEETVPASQEAIRTKTGFEVLDHRMEYYGLCRTCRAQVQYWKGRNE
jgi:Fe2+ or Zn2+ uptake regulation protein